MLEDLCSPCAIGAAIFLTVLFGFIWWLLRDMR